MVLNKKGANEGLMWVVAAVLVVLALQSLGLVNFKGSTSPSGGTSVTTSTNPTGQTCPVPGNTLTVGPMKVKNNPGTSVSGENARVYVNSVDQGSKADSSTMTVNAGSQVEIIYGIASSTYFTDYVKFTMPCGPLSSAEVSKQGSLFSDPTYTGAHELWQWDPQPVLIAFNGDTGNLNNGTGVDNETIGASGDTGRFGISLTTVADKAIAPARHGSVGSNNNIYIAVEVNATLYDPAKTIFSGGSATLSTFRPSTNILALANSVDDITVFQSPGCPTGGIRSCNLNLGTLLVQTKSGAGNDPGVLNTGGLSNAAVGNGAIKLTIMQPDYYRHTIDNTIQFGVQKDDGTYAFNRGVVNTYFLSTA